MGEMGDKYVLIEYISSINNVFSEKFQTIQRIKLTCFDVSNKYIVFGASSGGIYIFKRDPAEFVKLIPSKVGPASQISISPNEKHVAIASTLGILIILENFLSNTGLEYQLYSEHDGCTIMDMIWFNDNLFCGDNMGKITITTLVKSLFQPPTVTLMQLDSSIVQLDACSNYLLASTTTRTYLCNTEKEQYQQIGKKLRVGCFGACFYNPVSGVLDFGNNDIEDLSEKKIYCARPGVRLWEANFDASVVVTYQFRNSLLQNPSKLLLLNNNLNVQLTETVHEGLQDFNFAKLYQFCERFILTYDTNGVYIFDPSLNSMVFWINKWKNIQDVKIAVSLLYIWQKGFQIDIISLETLEHMLLKTLFRKQYFLCAEICVYFMEDVLNLIGKSSKIHLLSILNEKLHENGSAQILKNLMPIIDKLKESNSEIVSSRKLASGMVVIKNSHAAIEDNLNVYDNSSYNYTFDNLGKIKEPNKCSKDSDVGIKSNIKILYKQYKLNKVHRNLVTSELSNLFNSKDLNSIRTLLDDFMQHVQQNDAEDANLWCKRQLVDHVIRKTINITSLGHTLRQILEEAIIGIIKTPDLACKCNFPIPKAHTIKPQYLKLCVSLLEMSSNESFYCNIPYLYRVKLSLIDNLDSLNNHLSLLVQYSDKNIYKCFLQICTYDTWDAILKHVVNLSKKKCLNCSADINIDKSLSWTELGILIVQSIGAVNSTKLLQRYSRFIPKEDLTAEYYQMCIFYSEVDNKQENPQSLLAFTDRIIGNQSSQEFEKSVVKYLNSKYLWASELRFGAKSDTSKCCYCDLGLDNQILNEITTFSCNHKFHSICAQYINICNMCYHKV